MKKSAPHVQSCPGWRDSLEKLFPKGIPKSHSWTSLEDVIAVLLHLTKCTPSPHIFLPAREGMDLTGVAKCEKYPNAISFLWGFWYHIKPVQLMFESFGDAYDWAYFRMEADVPASYHFQARMGSLVRDPTAARSYGRFVRSAFVIFAKESTYSLTAETYFGLHNTLNAEEFRKLIDKCRLKPAHLPKIAAKRQVRDMTPHS